MFFATIIEYTTNYYDYDDVNCFKRKIRHRFNNSTILEEIQDYSVGHMGDTAIFLVKTTNKDLEEILKMYPVKCKELRRHDLVDCRIPIVKNTFVTVLDYHLDGYYTAVRYLKSIIKEEGFENTKIKRVPVDMLNNRIGATTMLIVRTTDDEFKKLLALPVTFDVLDCNRIVC